MRDTISVNNVKTFSLNISSELISCSPVSMNVAPPGHKAKFHYYIELCLSLSRGQEVLKRPRVRCQSEEMSKRAAHHVSVGQTKLS